MINLTSRGPLVWVNDVEIGPDVVGGWDVRISHKYTKMLILISIAINRILKLTC